jgi:hypothetical protein
MCRPDSRGVAVEKKLVYGAEPMPLMKLQDDINGGCPVPSIVIEIPEKFNTLASALQIFAADVLAAAPVSSGGRPVDYAGFEKAIGEAGARLECAVHGDVLRSLDVDAEQVMISGTLHRKVGRYSATCYTMAGPVEVERSLYRAVGERNPPTVDPISLRAGAIGAGWLPRTAQAMAYALQQGTSREAEQSALQTGRLLYSRSAYEDVGHLVGAEFTENQTEIEGKLIEAYVPPSEARSVSVSLDRVSVPMEEPRQRPRGRPKKNAPKRPIERRYRMAYCGTVTLHDGEGKALHTIRYGRMPQGDSLGLAQAMAGDVEVLLKKKPRLKVSMLQDGAPELWNLLSFEVNEEDLGVEIHKLVDLWHLMEKLGKAAVLIHGVEESRAVMRRWYVRLVNSETARVSILSELRASSFGLRRAACRGDTTCSRGDHVPDQQRRQDELCGSQGRWLAGRQRAGGGNLQEPDGAAPQTGWLSMEGGNRRAHREPAGLGAE